MGDPMHRTPRDLRDEEDMDRLDDRGLLRLILQRENKALKIIERMSLDQRHLKLTVDELVVQTDDLSTKQRHLVKENAFLRKEITTMRRIANTVPRFTYFTKLPPEIRFRIWDLALPRRFVRVERREDWGEVDDGLDDFDSDALLDMESKHSPPAVSQVCQEARAIAVRNAGFRAVQHGAQTFAGMLEREPPASYRREWTWFDSARDTFIRPAWIISGQDPDYQHLDSVVQHVFLEDFQGALGSVIPDLFDPRVYPKLRSLSFVVDMIPLLGVVDMPAPSASAHQIPRDSPYDVVDIENLEGTVDTECPKTKDDYDGQNWFFEDYRPQDIRGRCGLKWPQFREGLIEKWQSERPQEKVPLFRRVAVLINIERSPKGPARRLED
ncbi:hypothetical protein SLS62_002584 [Diatrype stigma]|uniref:2EXR domain-containing protein n=1 Tax=Diatrype stigma TaxID=117547 RepID=A0AAN9YQM6_9PEZI